MKMKYTVAIAICIMLLTGCIRYNSEYTNNELEPRDLQGTISLEDDTRVYVKLRSGRLKIRFNKDENSETAFERMKDLTDKLKATLYNSEAQLH